MLVPREQRYRRKAWRQWKPARLIEYPQNQKAYQLSDPSAKTVVLSQGVKFAEGKPSLLDYDVYEKTKVIEDPDEHEIELDTLYNQEKSDPPCHLTEEDGVATPLFRVMTTMGKSTLKNLP